MSGNHDHQSPDAGPSKHPLSRRLPQEAYAVLNDYYYNVTNRPTKPQRMELIRQIHKIPGCDWYTEGNVQRFAASKRKAQRHAAASKDNSTVVRAILYPSLEPSHLTRLGALLEDDPDPTPHILQIWATKLNVVPEDVVTWFELTRERLNRPNLATISRGWASTSPHVALQTRYSEKNSSQSPPHLPTPASTASPEPASPLLTSHFSFGDHIQRGLADLVLSTLSTHVSSCPDTDPRSPAEIQKSFEQHEQSMLAFMQKIQNGEYESLGLTAADIKPIR